MSAPPAAYPLDGLPEWLTEYVAHVAWSVDVGTDMALAFALGAMSGATRGEWTISTGDGWDVGPAVLWVVALAPSGERKTSTRDRVLAPLYAAEEGRWLLVKRDRQALRGAPTRGKDTPPPMRPVLDYVLSDVTAAGLVEQMCRNGGAVLLETDEGSELLGALVEDRQGSPATWCHGFDGSPIKQARVSAKTSTGTRSVARATLSLCMAIQPGPLAGVIFSEAACSAGMPARVLWFVPERMSGRRSFDSRPPDPRIVSGWADRLTALHAAGWSAWELRTGADLEDMSLAPRSTRGLLIEQGGRDMLAGHALSLDRASTEHTAQVDLLFGGAHPSSSYRDKDAQKWARVAALLALMEDPHRSTVPAGYVAAALSLSSAGQRHAVSAARVMRDDGTDGVEAVVDWAWRNTDRAQHVGGGAIKHKISAIHHGTARGKTRPPGWLDRALQGIRLLGLGYMQDDTTPLPGDAHRFVPAMVFLPDGRPE